MKPTTQLSDASLIEQYQQGNDEAFNELSKKYQAKIHQHIYLLVKDKFLSDDLLQEVFIRIINKLRNNNYAEIGKFLPWALTIAHNIVIDHKRKVKTKPTILSFDSDDYQSAFHTTAHKETEWIKTETEQFVNRCINKLPQAQREVIAMKIYGNLTFKTIGNINNTSINTAIGRMQYGLKNMRKIMIAKEIAA